MRPAFPRFYTRQGSSPWIREAEIHTLSGSRRSEGGKPPSGSPTESHHNPAYNPMKRFLPFLFLFALVAFVGCDSNDDDGDNLDGPATITGQITDSQQGDAIAGARVIFTRPESNRGA